MRVLGIAPRVIMLVALGVPATVTTTSANPKSTNVELTPLRLVSLTRSDISPIVDPLCNPFLGVGEINGEGFFNTATRTPFRIPDGQVFVLTDLEYFTEASSLTVTLSALRGQPSSGAFANGFNFSLSVAARPLNGTEAYGETHLTTGVVIGPDHLCVSPNVTSIHLQGFFAKGDQKDQ